MSFRARVVLGGTLLAIIILAVVVFHEQSKQRHRIARQPGVHTVPVTRVEDVVAPDGDSSRATPSGAARTVVVRTRDENREPIAARLFVAAPNQSTRPRFVGTTSSGGVLRVPVYESEAHGSVTARADGFSIATAKMAGLADGEITLTLWRGADLGGVVSRADGTPCPSGVRVVAFARSAWAGGLDEPGRDPRLLSATTNDRGRFMIGGAVPGADYVLVAGGSRVATSDPVTARAPRDDVALTVGYVYAVIVRLVEVGGGPVRASSNIGTDQHLNLSPVDPSIKTLWADGPGSRLTGISPDLLRELGPWEECYVFTSPHDRAEIGPVNLYRTIPGYKPFKAPLTAYPVGRRIRSVQVALTPESSWFGDVEVELLDAPAVDVAPGLQLEAGWLYFDKVGGVRFLMPIKLVSNGVRVVRGLPAGAYDVRLSTTVGSLQIRADPARVQVGRGSAPPRVRLSFGTTGAIMAELVDPSSRSRTLPTSVDFEVRSLRPDAAPFRRWIKRPPFVFQAIEAGSYRITGRAGGLVFGPTVVTVAPGRVAKAHLTLRQ